MKKYNIFCCGVGGQGIVTLGQILKIAGVDANLRVIGTETRGATMREGSVTSTVRFGIPEEGEQQDERSQLYAGRIGTGTADMIIASEPQEGLRWAFYANEKTIIAVNEYPMPSSDNIVGGVHYPTKEEWVEKLKTLTPNIYSLNASMIAKEKFGGFQKMNVVLMGFAMGCDPNFPVSLDQMKKTLENMWPKAAESNRRALELGYEEAQKLIKK
ncbi:MAG: 2-oxoacid:acceptor oxidoreductase family protein [Candidatus Helarchaeota archaeon]